jgi:transcriptional regulator with XRE-family HTH domain
MELIPQNQIFEELFMEVYPHYYTALKLKTLREQRGLSQQDLADKTSIPKERIAKWEQGKGSPKLADSVTLDKFFEEDVPREYTKTRQFIKNNSTKKKTIPFYDAPASAGLTETEMSAMHAPAGTIDVGDLLHDSEAAIRIYGNSMLPNYPPGCVVGLAKISNTFIEPGEVYVIETRDRRLLKRLFYKNDKADEKSFTCYSDNIMKFEGGARDGKLAYPPFDLPKKEIINLFVVTGVIKRNANSIIINR